MARKRRKRWHLPGTMPGTLAAHAEADGQPVRVALFRYDGARFEAFYQPGRERTARQYRHNDVVIIVAQSEDLGDDALAAASAILYVFGDRLSALRALDAPR